MATTTSLLFGDKKKVILITGCDSGFGFSLACHMSDNHREEFLTIACSYFSSSEGAEILKGKSNVKVLPLDVTVEESVQKLVQQIDIILEEENAELWAVVNNAAASLVFADATWQTQDMVKKQFDVNVIGCWKISKVFQPHLMASRGRIINMISFCTECALPTLSIYTATKAALLSLSNGMRMELSKYGIDVILFNPGDHPMETPLCFGQSANYELMRPDITKRFENTFPHVLQDFDAYKQKFETTFPESPTVQKLDSPGLYRNFDRMIFDSRPNHKYVNSDWKSIGFFGFMKMIPSIWSDKLSIKLMRLPTATCNTI